MQVPHFNVSAFATQIFWLIISFIIFFLFIKYYFLPKILSIMQYREEQVDLLKDATEFANNESKKIVYDYNTIINNTKNTHLTELNILKNRLKSENEKVLHDLNITMNESLKDYEMKIIEKFKKNANKYEYIQYNFLNMTHNILNNKYLQKNND